jgi:hypothetical protein
MIFVALQLLFLTPHVCLNEIHKHRSHLHAGVNAELCLLLSFLCQVDSHPACRLFLSLRPPKHHPPARSPP